MQTGKIGVTSENLFPIIKKRIFSQSLKSFFILITTFFYVRLYQTQ